MESNLTKDLTELKIQLIIQQKLLEEKEVTLELMLQDKKNYRSHARGEPQTGT